MREITLILPEEHKGQEELLNQILTDQNIVPRQVVHNDFGLQYIFLISPKKESSFISLLTSRGFGNVFGTIISKVVSESVQPDQDRSLLREWGTISYSQILSSLEEYSRISRSFIFLVCLAAVIASIGLIINDQVAIIGSMIVAPLLGPIALTSLYLLNPRSSRLFRAISLEVVGICLTVLVGFLMGIIYQQIGATINTPFTGVTTEMRVRTTVTLTQVVLATVSGLAAGVFIIKGQGVSIVGVAIAAALAPPAATIGLLLSLAEFADATDTLILLVLNIVAVNLSCAFVFSITNISRSSGVSKRNVRRSQRRRRIIFGIVFLVYATVVFLVVVGDSGSPVTI